MSGASPAETAPCEEEEWAAKFEVRGRILEVELREPPDIENVLTTFVRPAGAMESRSRTTKKTRGGVRPWHDEEQAEFDAKVARGEDPLSPYSRIVAKVVDALEEQETRTLLCERELLEEQRELLEPLQKKALTLPELWALKLQNLQKRQEAQQKVQEAQQIYWAQLMEAQQKVIEEDQHIYLAQLMEAQQKVYDTDRLIPAV